MKCEQTEQSWCLVLVGSSLNVVLQLYENITHKQSKQQRLTVLKYTGQLSLAIPLWEGAVTENLQWSQPPLGNYNR